MGVRSGLLHLVWSLGWFSRTELSVPRAVDDGQWHRVEVTRSGQYAKIDLDGETFGSRVSGSFFELNVKESVLFGQ